ncbi:MAG: 2-hydroxyacyl-CoA dehydratase [Desulfobacterales bacterium]|nr:2-hydroxyacyl-CoA dehydratase [Desulfobacterales bacterium]
MTPNTVNKRLQQLQHKTKHQICIEFEDQVELIRQQPDYISEIEPFLNVLKYSLHPCEFQQQINSTMVMALCIQAPLELFHAARVRIFKLACGSFAARNMATRSLPALTCPMIKSSTGMLQSQNNFDLNRQYMVFPTTCDWVVKWRELTGMDKRQTHYMDLPHLRENEQSSNKWLEELYSLKKWLEAIVKKSITRKDIFKAIKAYMDAFRIFSKLIELRRQQRISSVHFAVITNALTYDNIENWTACTGRYILYPFHEKKESIPIFLAGSPIIFPNVKLLTLIEASSMRVAADDICSMERVFPGPACYEDKSEYALMRALSHRYHRACICPTFADNERRLNGMVNVLKNGKIKGVIFHVLKGCHPYDIESVIMENKLKTLGYRFLKIETDYVKEDEQNIVTRLEAFRQTLKQIKKQS